MSRKRVLRLEISIGSDKELAATELAALEGALLAARATERSHARRRNERLSFGYGSDSAREAMNDEVAQAHLRETMLDRLLISLRSASTNEGGDHP